jgi:hypothetical protein
MINYAYAVVDIVALDGHPALWEAGGVAHTLDLETEPVYRCLRVVIHVQGIRVAQDFRGSSTGTYCGFHGFPIIGKLLSSKILIYVQLENFKGRLQFAIIFLTSQCEDLGLIYFEGLCQEVNLLPIEKHQ